MNATTKNKIPAIRFAGFSEDWKNSKLKDLTIPVAGNDGRQNLPILTISAAHGFLDQKDRFSQVIAGNELKKYTLLRKGELSYNRGNSKLAKFGVVYSLMNYEEALVPNIYHSFKVNKDSNSFFIESLFESKLPDRELGKLVSSTARMDGMLNINSSDFMGIAINHPTVEEQTQIGNFFQQLDKLIELQSRAVESAETYKKAMLQKMFPQKGEKVPRVRFEGFSGDWEERKVGDIFTATRGQVLAATKVSPIKVDSYQYPVYSSQTKDNGLLGYYDSFLFENAITWTTDGANAGTVNYRKEKFYSTNVNGVLLSDAGFANPTISEILNSVAFKYVSRVGNPKLMNNIMVDIPIIIPPLLEEQIMIGNYIQKLDQNIEAEKKKLEQYQTMKRAMLQRMFV